MHGQDCVAARRSGVHQGRRDSAIFQAEIDEFLGLFIAGDGKVAKPFHVKALSGIFAERQIRFHLSGVANEI